MSPVSDWSTQFLLAVSRIASVEPQFRALAKRGSPKCNTQAGPCIGIKCYNELRAELEHAVLVC